MKNALLFTALCTGGLGCASPLADDAEEMVTAQHFGIVGGALDPRRAYVVGVAARRGGVCSGTVISRRIVVTAGHCADAEMRVYFGAQVDRRSMFATVAQVVRHPGFHPTSLANDLAILRLASDAPVQPAPLLRELMANDPAYVGPDFTFVGYGLTNGAARTGIGTRRAVAFPIQAVGPAEVGGTPGTIGETQFYYQAPDRNTCGGDSGGPAFLVRNGIERHAGVTSFGDKPCIRDGVQARTDAPQIATFIQPAIDALEGDDPCRADGSCEESCNRGHELVDPDCAERHCGRDGVCALACVAPVDPDCSSP